MSGSDIPAEGARRRLVPSLEVRIWWPHPPLGRWIEHWRSRRRDRHTLAGLDDHVLCDLGLDRADVDTQSTQSFWRQR